MKNRYKIIKHIEDKIKMTLIKYNAAMVKDLEKLINVNERNGMINSNSFNRIVEMRLHDVLYEIMDKLFEVIKEEEKILNIKLRTEEIEEIWDLCSESVNNFINTNIRQSLTVALEYRSYNPEIFINTALSNVEYKMNSFFEDFIYYNENTKRPPTLKELKLSNLLSSAAIVISIVSLYMSLTR